MDNLFEIKQRSESLVPMECKPVPRPISMVCMSCKYI